MTESEGRSMAYNISEFNIFLTFLILLEYLKNGQLRFRILVLFSKFSKMQLITLSVLPEMVKTCEKCLLKQPK